MGALIKAFIHVYNYTNSSGRRVEAGWLVQISCLNTMAGPSHGRAQ